MSNQRTAVVSGGGTGIGLGIADALMADGYHVMLVGRRPHVLQAAVDTLTARDLAGTVDFVTADLSDVSETQEAMTDAVKRLGGAVDVVVANAGRPSTRPTAEFESHRASWLDALEGNTITTVLLVQALRPHLSDTGRLIFVSSAAATGPGGGAYGAAKAALHGWMYDLAVELGPSGVTCNVVSPGFIDDTGLFSGRLTDARRDRFIARTLVKRGGLPADVADCVRWLAAETSGYVTAQVIGIDGGALVDAG